MKFDKGKTLKSASIINFLFSIGISLVIFVVMYFLIKNYDVMGNMLDWWKVHLRYIGVLFLSCVSVLSILKSNIFFKNNYFGIILLINFFAGTYLFLTESFNFALIQITLFVFVILTLILLFKLKHWIRYVLTTVLVFFALGFLLISVLPMFGEEPDIAGFVESQNMGLQLVNYGGTDNIASLVILADNKKIEYDFDESSLKSDYFELGSFTRFDFASSDIYDKKSVILLLPDYGQFIIGPQSSVSISLNGNILEASAIQGELWFFESPHGQKFFEVVVYSGSENKLNHKQILQIEKNLENHQENLSEYLLDQVGGIWVELKTSRWFMKIFLDIMFSLYPEKYGQNVLNYQSFDKYFEFEEEKYESLENEVLTKGLENDLGKGFDKTRFWEKMSDR